MWTLYGNGWLMPVDDVIGRLGGDKYFMPLPGYAEVGGHRWGVPMSSYTMHIEYRKDLFEKKGLKEPRTWDDLLKAAKALTEDLNGDGRIDRYGIAAPLKTEYSVDVFFLSFLWGNGGNVLDRNGKVIFNSAETIQTLNFFKELYKYAPPGVTGYGWMELISTYIQDKVAMTTFSNLKPIADAIKQDEAIAKNTGVVAIPTRLPNQTPKGRWANMTWMVLKDSKYPELAKDFVAFWFDPKRLTQYYHAEPIFTVPGETPVIKSKEYWANDLLTKYRPAVEKLIELNQNGIDPNMEYPGLLQPNTGMIAQRMIIAECVQEVVLGKSSAEEAAAKAHKKMEEFLAKKQ
jgi:multiple sugar transport system substrate-binding protein